MEMRRRAFEALRELLYRVAALGTLVIHIDDMQWSDADSVLRIQELMRGPSPPPLFLLLAARSEHRPRHPAVRRFLYGARAHDLNDVATD